jgi:Arc/MetJ-type ribon-helix-helix transcriptional regulator
MFTPTRAAPSMTTRRLAPEQRAEAIRQLKEAGGIATVASQLEAPHTAIAKTRARHLRPSATATTGTKTLSVRLSPIELEVLERLKTRHAYRSNSDALRGMVRLAGGMLEFEPEAARRLEEIRTELHRIGVNVNQIAHAANRGRVDLIKQHWRAIGELRQGLPRLRGYLQAVVEEQRRQGVRLFRKIAEDTHD